MKNTTLAKTTGFSESWISLIISGKRKINLWSTAVIMANATKTAPEFWLTANSKTMKRLLKSIGD